MDTNYLIIAAIVMAGLYYNSMQKTKVDTSSLKNESHKLEKTRETENKRRKGRVNDFANMPAGEYARLHDPYFDRSSMLTNKMLTPNQPYY